MSLSPELRISLTLFFVCFLHYFGRKKKGSINTLEEVIKPDLNGVQSQPSESDGNCETTLEKGRRNPDATLDYFLKG